MPSSYISWLSAELGVMQAGWWLKLNAQLVVVVVAVVVAVAASGSVSTHIVRMGVHRVLLPQVAVARVAARQHVCQSAYQPAYQVVAAARWLRGVVATLAHAAAVAVAVVLMALVPKIHQPVVTAQLFQHSSAEVLVECRMRVATVVLAVEASVACMSVAHGLAATCL
jgi:hypothetical protein